MHFDCRFTYYPQPFEPNLFLREMTIDVVCGVDDFASVVAARLAVDHLDIGRVTSVGGDIYEVCDADSSGWEAVFAGLFEPGSQAEWRGDFELVDPIDDLLFMHHSVFHPALREWQAYIIDHVAKLFGNESAFVMWKEETDLTDAELDALGFRVIAGTDLRLRPNMYQQKYNAVDDERDAVNLCVPADAEEYVNANWKGDRSDELDATSIVQAVFKARTGGTLTVEGETAAVWTPEGRRETMYRVDHTEGKIELRELPLPFERHECRWENRGLFDSIWQFTYFPHYR